MCRYELAFKEKKLESRKVNGYGSVEIKNQVEQLVSEQINFECNGKIRTRII